jgi:hypothetical protein
MKNVCLILALFAAPAILRAQQPDAAGIEFFEQKIRPVLVQHCYSCHSEEARSSKKLQASLLLDSRQGVLAGGESGPVIVIGKSSESPLVTALKYDGLEMPPAGRLPDSVVADFAKWIDMGAPDPRAEQTTLVTKREINVEEGKHFWSFRPLSAVAPLDVADMTWVRTPVDRFVLAKHEEKGLRPNQPAGKETLIRRMYFDLVGLPPTPKQIEDFVADESPGAIEKVIDDLLSSQRYGERWGRHWLDVARFAESGGYEFDGFRPGAYHYRDWVIRSLNADMPYDEFIRMQLAGDKLKPDDYQGAAATGFLVAGPYPGQITAKTVERIRYDQLDDMLMTVGGSMLGLTLGCVRCHDHKFDPISQQDYYGLAASLAKTVHGTVTFDLDPEATQRARDKHTAEHEPLVTALKSFAETELPKRFEPWKKKDLNKQPESPRWQIAEPVNHEAARSYLKLDTEGVVAHDGNKIVPSPRAKRGQRTAARPFDMYTITFQTFQKSLTALRLDAFTHKSLPSRGPGLNVDGSFQLAEIKVTAAPLDSAATEKPVELKLLPVFAAFEDKDQPLKNAVDQKPATAWVVKTTAGKDNAAIFEIEGGLAGFANGTELKIELRFRDVGLGRMRFAFSTTPNPASWAGDLEPQHVGEIRAMLAANKNQIPSTANESLARWFSSFDAETARHFNAVRDHAAKKPRPKAIEVYTTIAGGEDVFLLRRGEVDNKQGKAEPGFIQVLHRTTNSTGDAAKGAAASSEKTGPPDIDPRIRLGDWMTDVDTGAGGLLARVMVNRIWQHHFGEGLVGTPNDFGAQGERPSHPELLEWLSAEFVRGGWQLKPLHKMILLSAVYQQSNAVRPENLKLDPENKFFWHHKPRRLEAEVIRDAMLSVADTMDTTMYGPSVMDNSSRRSVYLRVKRSELIPFMTTFDSPEPTQSIGERISTTVPTQALAIMNSGFVRTAAEKFAARIATTDSNSFDASIDKGYRIAFARLPSTTERDRMRSFINQLVAQGTTTDQAIIEFCQVLMCLNEFVYVD